MKNIKIIPLTGIEIEQTGNVSLGQSKASIENLLGRPSSRSNDSQWYYDEHEFRIDFDKKNNAEFIEFICGPFPEKIILSLYGIDPFTIGANNLVEILTKENNGALDDSEADFSYSFLNISVGIWRQFSDSNVSENIEEMKANGEYEANKKWLEEDLAKSINFWTIGIGVKAYYKSV